MNMPENSNISDSAQEEAFDKKVSSIISKDMGSNNTFPVSSRLSGSALDDAIWQNTRELLDYELEKRLVWQRIGYFISTSAAAVILLSVIVYILLAPAGIPSNWLSAMEQEHQSFIQGNVKPITSTDLTGSLSAHLRTGNLLSGNECCCTLLKSNKELRLEGGDTKSIGGCPCAAIYAKYNVTPVTFMLFEASGGFGRIESAYRSYPSPIWTDKTGKFNVAVKRLPNCLIGVISELDEQTLVKLLKNVDTMGSDCKCGHK